MKLFFLIFLVTFASVSCLDKNTEKRLKNQVNTDVENNKNEFLKFAEQGEDVKAVGYLSDLLDLVKKAREVNGRVIPELNKIIEYIEQHEDKDISSYISKSGLASLDKIRDIQNENFYNYDAVNLWILTRADYVVPEKNQELPNLKFFLEKLAVKSDAATNALLEQTTNVYKLIDEIRDLTGPKRVKEKVYAIRDEFLKEDLETKTDLVVKGVQELDFFIKNRDKILGFINGRIA